MKFFINNSKNVKFHDTDYYIKINFHIKTIIEKMIKVINIKKQKIKNSSKKLI
jgi:hypothetical protein